MKLEGTFTDRMKTDGWLLLHKERPRKEDGSGVNGISYTGKPGVKKKKVCQVFCLKERTGS